MALVKPKLLCGAVMLDNGTAINYTITSASYLPDQKVWRVLASGSYTRPGESQPYMTAVAASWLVNDATSQVLLETQNFDRVLAGSCGTH